ncbi:MAG: DUF1810 domain-containing protein [Bacteroidetes bacterium]|nr:DUF1810 domain-containing protein [Bacteroidota bacterium]
MKDSKDLVRFLDAQNQVYLKAIAELRTGQKLTNWMDFIFPHIKGLDHSNTDQHFTLVNLEEATAYLAHPVLGKHLIQISQILLEIENKSVHEIFSTPDDIKLCSCMTLFAQVNNTNPVFEQVLKKYYFGEFNNLTLELLAQKSNI